MSKNYEYKRNEEVLVIYDKFDLDFEEPIGLLKDVQSVSIKEVLNGDYTLDFTAPYERYSDKLKPENFVKVNEDYFKITKTTRNRTGDGVSVSVSCEHVYFELLDDYIPRAFKKTMSPEELAYIINTYTSNIKLEVDDYIVNNREEFPEKRLFIQRGSPILAINVLLEAWDLFMIRQGRKVKIYKKVKDSAIQLFKHQKNLASFSREKNSRSITTRIYPLGNDDLTIQGLAISDIPYRSETKDGKTTFFSKNNVVLGRVGSENGKITTAYIDSKYINSFPTIKNAEFSDSADKQKDLFINAIRQLNTIESELMTFSLDVEELKYIHGEVERFGLGFVALIQDEVLLKDEEFDLVESLVVEYEYYPFDRTQNSKVTIGQIPHDAIDAISEIKEIKDKVSNIKDSYDDEDGEEEEEEEEGCCDRVKLIEETLDLAKCKLIGPDHKDIDKSTKTYSHDNENGTCDCFVLSKNIDNVNIELTNQPFIVRAKGGFGITNHSLYKLGKLFFSKINDNRIDDNGIDISGLEFKNSESVATLFMDKKMNLFKGYDSDFDFSNVKSMGSMFWGAEFYEDFVVRYKNLKKVEDTSLMFKDTVGVKKIEFLNSEFKNLHDSERMFESSDVKEVKFTNVSEIKTMNNATGMFYNCKDLRYVGGEKVRFIFNTIGNETGDQDDIIIPSIRRMFYNCENLEQLDLELISEVELGDMSIIGAFYNCKKLKTIRLGKLQVNVTKDYYLGDAIMALDDTFNGCLELEELTLPTVRNDSYSESTGEYTIKNYMSIKRAFKNTPKLKGIIDLTHGFFIKDDASYVEEFAVNCGAEKILINKQTAYKSNGEYSDIWYAMNNEINNPNQIKIEITEKFT